MAIDIKNINLKNLPPYLRIVIALIPSILLVILFIVFIYSPKNKKIDSLNEELAKLDNEIASGEVKVRKLDELKAENDILKAKLAKLQEQLPEEEEVSVLLKQISDLGLKSGLEILLWKPEPRQIGPEGLYAEIPVKVEVLTGYHNLGVFYSHISRLQRIVNITDIKLGVKGKRRRQGGGEELITAKFTALTFAALSPEEQAEIKKGKKGRGKMRKRR